MTWGGLSCPLPLPAPLRHEGTSDSYASADPDLTENSMNPIHAFTALLLLSWPCLAAGSASDASVDPLLRTVDLEIGSEAEEIELCDGTRAA